MNDLIGLQYRWGARPSDGEGCTDCFQLVCEVRRRLGLRDYAEQFEWVYEEYTSDTFTLLQLRRFLERNGQVVELPECGDVLLFPSTGGAVMGVVIEGWVMFITAGQTVGQASMPRGVGQYFRMR
jgi:cell wall-associated NlpC family hydrolase